MEGIRSSSSILTFLLLLIIVVEGGKIPEISIFYPPLDFPAGKSSYLRPLSYRVFYQPGQSARDLPECAPSAVCNKVDVYDVPWVERQCRCPGSTVCSSSTDSRDGFTITEKSTQHKLCEPVNKLPTCRYFRDVTWKYVTHQNNVTQQIVNCVCPKNSVAYIVKRTSHHSNEDSGFHYSFACSPESRIRCQRKEPCRLFTVKKRESHEEVNPSTLCKCPHNHQCPTHHMDPGSIPGKAYSEDAIKTYSAFCIQPKGS